jgi:hypothetical protein
VGAAEAGADVTGELEGQFEVLVAGERKAPVEVVSKDAVDGLDELTGEMDSGPEAEGEGPGRGGRPPPAGLAEDPGGDTAVRDGAAKLEITGQAIAPGPAQVALEAVSQGPDERAVQVRVASTVHQGCDLN